MKVQSTRIKWDANLARRLWHSAASISSIAEQVGTSRRALVNAASRYEWGKRKAWTVKPGPKVTTVKRRCGCGAIYRTSFEHPHQHCSSTAFRSRYEEVAA